MATLEDEIKDLKQKNNEMAQEVQYWKMTAAQKDNEKFSLKKEVNELRLKLSRLRNNGGLQASKLDAALQDASEKAISHLVKASAEIAKSMEIAKGYIREWQELDAQSPHWSSTSGTTSAEKRDRVHRVPPMMMGGQSIQPVVSLSRTMLNTSSPRTTTRSPNQNRSLTERAVPMHMLQDVYIPLTRIDISDLPNNNMEIDMETNNAEDSPEEFVEEFIEHRLGGGQDDGLDSDDHTSEGDEYDSKLEPISEEEDTSVNVAPVSLRLQVDPSEDRWHRPDPPQEKLPEPPVTNGSPYENPLEGPSWLLDSTPTNSDRPRTCKGSTSKTGRNLEPDSTTEVDKTPNTCRRVSENMETESSPAAARAFSPTVRRRKRTSSPPALATPRQIHYSPRPASARRNSTSGRVLKVLVAKMRLDGSAGGCASPQAARAPPALVFDAPSPNGATDAGVIVSTRLDEEMSDASVLDSSMRERNNITHRANSHETEIQHQRRRRSREHDNSRRVASEHERRDTQDTRESHHRSRVSSAESRDSAGGAGDAACEGRTRRPRKPITYKEKPLNRKLRR